MIKYLSKVILLLRLISSLFSTCKASGNIDKNISSHYHEDNLLITVVNLFTAGSETTSITIRYGLMLMAKYPEIQGKKYNTLIYW